MSVPKSGSIICDKAFSTSLSTVSVENAEAPATLRKQIRLQLISNYLENEIPLAQITTCKKNAARKYKCIELWTGCSVVNCFKFLF